MVLPKRQINEKLICILSTYSFRLAAIEIFLRIVVSTLCKDVVERIKNYLVYIFSNFSKSTHQMYAKKLHTLRLWQKNCTPSGFYGKKIAPFWAASLSEIAI